MKPHLNNVFKNQGIKDMHNKALFLDRDGVINIDYDHIFRIKDFHFIEGIFDIAHYAQYNGYLLIVITNQAGIGRGLYTIEDFNILSDWMCEQFRNKDIKISKIYHSPYHPTAGLGKYKRNHISRKPNPGMIIEASVEFDLDLANSIFIGDRKTDMEAGLRAGVGKNLLFSPNEECSDHQSFDYITIRSLHDAAVYVQRYKE